MFDEARRAIRFTERDFSRTAAMYLEALKRNPDVAAQASFSSYIGQAHSEAGPLARRAATVRERERSERPAGGDRGARFDQAVVARIGRARRGGGGRSAAETGVAGGRRERRGPRSSSTAPSWTATVPRSRELVNAGNVNLPMVMPNGNVSPQTPISGALQHCGLPQLAPAKVASAVAQLVALGADTELRSPSGYTALDYAKAACPAEVQQALLGR